ncbi:hypothetical protein Tco_0321845 [Tanacetum coccineum]
MDSMHSTLSMYYDYDAHVKGELLVMMKNSQSVNLLIFISNTLIELFNDFGFDCDGIPKRPTMYLNLWSYKAVRHRYSNPMIQPEPEGSTQGYPLVSVEVLRNVRIKGENPSAGSDRGLKKRKTSKDTKPTTGLKNKDSMSGSSKGTKSQPKSTRKSVPSEELVFEVADSDMPQDQVGNLGDNEDEPRDETASRRDWFKKPKPPQEPTDPDGNIGKTTKEGPAFKLLKGTHSNYAELEYDFEECYKALSEKLNWQGSDYPFDLSKPLPLITCGNRQRVPFEFFINNDLKYLQGAISTMTYTTSTTKTKAAQYDQAFLKEPYSILQSRILIQKCDHIKCD